MDARTEYRYNQLTWEEMNQAIEMQKVVLLPTGSTEQHGPHLPLETDIFLSESVCLEAGRRAPELILVLPPVSYGLNMHHIDFPGTIHIEPEVFIAFCLNITKSVAYHGFKKMALVNGHGSNGVLTDIVARRTVLETQSLCAAVNYFHFSNEAFAEVRESDVWAHADEYETSLYYYLAPEKVRKERIVDGEDVTGQYVSSDSTSNYPVRFSDMWGRWTHTGVHGAPSTGTAEKGKVVFESAVEGLIGFAREWQKWPIPERSDQHTGPVQSQIRW